MLHDELINQFPRTGKLTWIGLRKEKRQPMTCVTTVSANTDSGLEGDHYRGKNGKRQVTLIQQEHLAIIESLTGIQVTADMLRRNLAISGINLLALKNQTFSIGDAVFKATGLCHPCSRMESILGPGGYNAMRGHGGLTALVVLGGNIKTGDEVRVLAAMKGSVTGTI